jgi:serine/threonine protein kinase
LVAIDETKLLGSGQFGVVYKGFLLRNGEKEVVAVKTVAKGVPVEVFKALLSEIKIMAFLGKHENVVELIGANTQDIFRCESNEEIDIVR